MTFPLHILQSACFEFRQVLKKVSMFVTIVSNYLKQPFKILKRRGMKWTQRAGIKT